MQRLLARLEEPFFLSLVAGGAKGNFCSFRNWKKKKKEPLFFPSRAKNRRKTFLLFLLLSNPLKWRILLLFEAFKARRFSLARSGKKEAGHKRKMKIFRSCTEKKEKRETRIESKHFSLSKRERTQRRRKRKSAFFAHFFFFEMGHLLVVGYQKPFSFSCCFLLAHSSIFFLLP